MIVGLLFCTTMSLAWAAIRVEFGADQLVLPRIGFHNIRITCARVAVHDTHLGCAMAEFSARHDLVGRINGQGPLQWGPTRDAFKLEFTQLNIGGARGSVSVHQDRNASVFELALQNIDARFLNKALIPHSDALAGHEFEGGKISFKLTCRGRRGIGTECDLSGEIENLTLAGVNAAEDVDLGFALNVKSGDGTPQWRFEVTLQDGQLYVEPGFKVRDYAPGFVLGVADGPVQMQGELRGSPGGEWYLHALSLIHPQVATVNFGGQLSLRPWRGWGGFGLAFRSPDIARFYELYLLPVLIGSPLDSVQPTGALEFAIEAQAGRLRHGVLRVDGGSITDTDQRFSTRGISGEIAFHDKPEPLSSTLRWAGGRFFEAEIGAGEIEWVSQARELKAVRWRDVRVLDGILHMDRLRLAEPGLSGLNVELGGTLTGVSLQALTTAFEWPSLVGELNGVMPVLTYANDHLSIDGDLRVDLFGGSIVLSELEIADLFSAVPVLRTDVVIEGIVLEELTSTFSFGNIQGTLDGHIEALRLEAWQPVAFDAYLATRDDDPITHRISRQAVDNLSRIGAGASGAVSQGMLGFVPSYSYGKLGIGCKLERGYCALRGVEGREEAAFSILTRGGWLPPWIEINGVGRHVAWDTLVDGVKQMSKGDWEIEIGAGSARKH